ncbi:MAG: SDR family NAD(P)-dependent oxidoreductase [Cellulomonas sp.]
MTPVHDLSILVAGASGGLGSTISRLLSRAGARLTLLGRDRERLEGLGLGAALVVGDLRQPETAEQAVAAAVAAHGRLDGLVVASGVVAFGPVSELADEVLVDLFALNTLAPIRLLRAALPALTDSATAGRAPFVVHLSAIVAEQPAAGMAAYSASKGALTAFDAAAGRELRRAGIRLIDARPPHTETGLAGRPIAGTAPRLAQGLDPNDVAERVLAAVVGDERDLPSGAFG